MRILPQRFLLGDEAGAVLGSVTVARGVRGLGRALPRHGSGQPHPHATVSADPDRPFVEILRAWQRELPHDPCLVRAPVYLVRGEWDGRLRVVRVIRDYGMFDRRETPQYYPDVRWTG
jgi:hypothetical protein